MAFIADGDEGYLEFYDPVKGHNTMVLTPKEGNSSNIEAVLESIMAKAEANSATNPDLKVLKTARGDEAHTLFLQAMHMHLAFEELPESMKTRH